MKVNYRQITIGSRVRLLDDIPMFNVIYKKGHQFTVYGESYRGFNLIDDNGNKIDECLFIEDKLELIDRRLKIEKIKNNLKNNKLKC